MKRAQIIAVLALAGCVQHPLVDMTDIDPVAYQAVYDRCEATSSTVVAGGPIFVGAIMGATVGMGLASMIAGMAPGISAAEGWGALAGAGAGAAAGSLVDPLTGAPETYPSVADCLMQHGYKLMPAEG